MTGLEIMMKKVLTRKFALLFFVLLLPTVGIASDQNKAVEQIRRAYDDIGKKIELSEKGIEESSYSGIFCSELVVNRNNHIWPVVGNYKLSYRFYFELSHIEGHEYPDRLRKVVMTSSMSSRSYYSEYLFDESGALVFYFTKPNEPPIGDEEQRVEQRIYFAGGRPIRIINGQKVSDSLTAKDIQLARSVNDTSKEIKLFFTKSLALPNG